MKTYTEQSHMYDIHGSLNARFWGHQFVYAERKAFPGVGAGLRTAEPRMKYRQTSI